MTILNNAKTCYVSTYCICNIICLITIYIDIIINRKQIVELLSHLKVFTLFFNFYVNAILHKLLCVLFIPKKTFVANYINY